LETVATVSFVLPQTSYCWWAVWGKW